jgi:hypothetical protein
VRRKRIPAAGQALPDTLVPDLVVEQAHSVLEDLAPKKSSKCVVCAEECAPNSAEGLCWVCRRLKFSAWRDSDTQMPAQE